MKDIINMNPLSFFIFSFAISLKALKKDFLFAIRRLFAGVNYIRSYEFPAVLKNLQIEDDQKILDIGSPKLLAVFLCNHTQCTVFASDIQDEAISRWKIFLSKKALEEGKNHFEKQDARCLTYRNNFFDRVYSISVFEHIPSDGDTKGMKEIYRVLKPGGRAILTVPFVKSYHEEYVQHDVYERRRTGKDSIFYQRFYDKESLQSRLVEPSGLKLNEIIYFGENRIPLNKMISRVPLLLQSPLMFIMPFLSWVFIKETREDNTLKYIAGVVLIFEKEITRND